MRVRARVTVRVRVRVRVMVMVMVRLGLGLGAAARVRCMLDVVVDLPPEEVALSAERQDLVRGRAWARDR